jgi:hypothetical protein
MSRGTCFFAGGNGRHPAIGVVVTVPVAVILLAIRRWTKGRYVPLPLASPGWAGDLTGRHEFCFWKGHDWTERVRDNGVDSEDPAGAGRLDKRAAFGWDRRRPDESNISRKGAEMSTNCHLAPPFSG